VKIKYSKNCFVEKIAQACVSLTSSLSVRDKQR
jgi:hypothetical protein